MQSTTCIKHRIKINPNMLDAVPEQVAGMRSTLEYVSTLKKRHPIMLIILSYEERIGIECSQDV